jgi:hypothetical protein
MSVLTDEQLVMQCDRSVRRRRRVEIKVARRVIRELGTAGYRLRVNNGEEECPERDTEREIINDLFAVDEAHLIVYQGDPRQIIPAVKTSFVFFVFGNDGWDAVNDYGVSLSPGMGRVEAWITEQEERGL